MQIQVVKSKTYCGSKTKINVSFTNSIKINRVQLEVSSRLKVKKTVPLNFYNDELLENWAIKSKKNSLKLTSNKPTSLKFHKTNKFITIANEITGIQKAKI